MTPFQIASLVLCGPFAFLMFLKPLGILVLKDRLKGNASFGLTDATLLFVSLTVILIAFFGVK